MQIKVYGQSLDKVNIEHRLWHGYGKYIRSRLYIQTCQNIGHGHSEIEAEV